VQFCSGYFVQYPSSVSSGILNSTIPCRLSQQPGKKRSRVNILTRNFAHTGKRNPGGIVTKFCMSVDIQDVINCATFCDDRLRGSGVARGRISRFPIDLRRRPYNTLALPCECVIPSSDIKLPKYLNWLTCSTCCPST